MRSAVKNVDPQPGQLQGSGVGFGHLDVVTLLSAFITLPLLGFGL